MNNTALGAKKVLFISEAHESFYKEKWNMRWGEKRGTLVYL